MSKRRRGGSTKLPLFDLPLNSDEAGPKGAEGAWERDPEEEMDAEGTADDAPSGVQATEHDLQLDLIDLGSASTPAVPKMEGDPREDAESGASALLGDRLLAGLADLAVQLVMSGLAIAASHALGIVVTFADWMPFGVLALVFSFVYWVVPLAFWGQTPGMAWVGHRARATTGGGPLTFGQTFLRWLGAIVTLAFAGLPLLLAWTGRSLSDRLSHSETRIVYREYSKR